LRFYIPFAIASTASNIITILTLIVIEPSLLNTTDNIVHNLIRIAMYKTSIITFDCQLVALRHLGSPVIMESGEEASHVLTYSYLNQEIVCYKEHYLTSFAISILAIELNYNRTDDIGVADFIVRNARAHTPVRTTVTVYLIQNEVNLHEAAIGVNTYINNIIPDIFLLNIQYCIKIGKMQHPSLHRIENVDNFIDEDILNSRLP